MTVTQRRRPLEPGMMEAIAEIRQAPPKDTTPVLVEIRNLHAREVVITGDFSGWAPDRFPLRLDPDGVWRTRLHLVPGEHEYRLRVDGEWRDDPQAVRRVSNIYGGENCVLVVPESGSRPATGK
ncbi:MAG TPA: glycogen-binding domain-containing protein [Planctomycetota bacterium]|nr:glycogen-binding domain-containing protein [Planctomycetota bacterium]